MIKVTYILKNLTDCFYDGNGESIEGLLNLTDRAKFDKLNKCAFGDLRDNVKQKIGTGQFRDKVELNQLLRDPAQKIEFKLENRKGYKLATFLIG